MKQKRYTEEQIISAIKQHESGVNAFIESLNCKYRKECLNQNWFRSIDDAKHEIDQWRDHSNTIRSHSSLNYLTPVAFANRAA